LAILTIVNLVRTN